MLERTSPPSRQALRRRERSGLIGPVSYSWVLVVAAGLAVCLLLGHPSWAFLGTDLEEAQKQDFFTFFHLLEAERVKEPSGLTMVIFKPLKSPKFKELATVHATIDERGKVVAMDLELRRSFIDDRVNGIFARDIAGSFISSASAPGDAQAVKDLVNEIKFPRDTQGMTILTA
ncbi:MAG TPA: hypothetical protein V6D08_10575, partial [Candidatus Obscuribacterales bacterium]